MTRRLIDPGPCEFHQLDLPHASDNDRVIARHVHENFFADTDVLFALYAVPMSELIESALIGAILRKEFPAELYEEWRRSGTLDDEAPKVLRWPKRSSGATPRSPKSCP